MDLIELVSGFLRDFNAKMRVFGILFRDERGKNKQALIDLEITPAKRKEILGELQPEDYVEGPIEDTLYHLSDLWVFGKVYDGKEIYIKISLGRESQSPICISFHRAEHPLQYALKK